MVLWMAKPRIPSLVGKAHVLSNFREHALVQFGLFPGHAGLQFMATA
jgi:hypothetical protein